MSYPEDPDDELSEENIEKLASTNRGCRSCFNWLVAALLVLLLLALFWPVEEKQKKKPKPYEPPKFSVSSPKSAVLSDAKFKRLDLQRNYRTNYVLIGFKLKNEEARINNLSYDNFALIVKQGRLTKEIPAHRVSEELAPAKTSPWGRPLQLGRTIELEVLFRVAKEANVTAFRVYDADRRSNRYKEFPLVLSIGTTTSPESLY